MPDWFHLRARRQLKERRQREKGLAWAALWEIATRTPYLRKVEAVDQEPGHYDSAYYVAEVLVDSGSLIKHLEALGLGVVDPNAPFVLPLVEGTREVMVLSDMLPAWKEHCDTRPSARTRPSWGSDLQYIDGTAMREWSRAAEAEAAVERAQRALDRLYPALVDVHGYDVTAGRWVA